MINCEFDWNWMKLEITNFLYRGSSDTTGFTNQRASLVANKRAKRSLYTAIWRQRPVKLLTLHGSSSSRASLFHATNSSTFFEVLLPLHVDLRPVQIPFFDVPLFF